MGLLDCEDLRTRRWQRRACLRDGGYIWEREANDSKSKRNVGDLYLAKRISCVAIVCTQYTL